MRGWGSAGKYAQSNPATDNSTIARPEENLKWP